ncbi:MAG: hypothetical protein JXR83_03150, partial [Deltaproteobacteria bacterium]|nr:hypothetical protein [Deltaproteobacteria bacterium]
MLHARGWWWWGVLACALGGCPPGNQQGADCDPQHPCASGLECRDGKCQPVATADAGQVQTVTPSCNYDT